MTCQNCNSPNADAARFCSSCGAEVIPPLPPSVADDDGDEITRVNVGAGVLVTDSESASLIGRDIEGKYRINGKVGAGGMGTVYRAQRILIGDEVAIKVLHSQHVSEPQATARFRREAQAAARLKHPNAVSVYDFGVSSDGLVYLVMELVEGQSLRHIIRRQGPLTPSATADIITQACAALDEAHRNNIIHRDLKPDNIIVNASINGLRVKVLDFGIAKLRDLTAGNLTQTGSVMGTPHYMSPEQCLGEELDHRSDVYSLGIVLYEMLAGVVPFNSPISTAVVVQHVNQTPPSLRAVNLSISADLEKVVLHALEKKREARPQTAGTLADEVNGALHSYAVAPPSGPTYQPGPSFQPPLQPTMVMRTPVSGHAAVSVPGSGGFPNISATPSQKRSIIPVVIGVAALTALIAVGLVYFLFFSFSAKKSILSEIQKGNLVKPDGNSAYDLYAKYEQKDLSAADKEEIAREAQPKLEKRGDEIISGLKQDQIESEADWAEAIRLYTWLNKLRPNSAFESRMQFSQASLAFARKDFNAALADYQRAAKLQPNWSLVLNRLGRVYVNLKDKGNAREFYRQATVAEPGWIWPWINLGAVYLDLNDPNAAEPALRKAIGLDSQKAFAHNLLGQALEKQSRACEALEEYSTALELVTSNPTNTVNSDVLRRKVASLNNSLVCGD
jgi:serine/threonine protein kinase